MFSDDELEKRVEGLESSLKDTARILYMMSVLLNKQEERINELINKLHESDCSKIMKDLE